MKEYLKILAACLFLAAFLHGFYLVQIVLAELNYRSGLQTGVLSCKKPTYSAGLILPQGDIKDEELWPTSVFL